MKNLNNKRILLGVSGGIAAYKSCELVRRLRDAGAEVRVVMTESACAFVTPLSFQALSGYPVHRSLLDEAAEAAMGHIQLARWADIVLIAPASANTIGKLAQGLADDLLSTLVLACSCPVMIAPAMNQQMWLSAVVQQNIQRLKDCKHTILGPAEGSQACGDTGPGRMLEPEQLRDAVAEHFASGVLADYSVMVTAGPTHEAIDPVRYISNRSSGKMGYAIARAAAEAGARVTLLSGPSHQLPPTEVQCIQVESAADMQQAVMRHIAEADVFIAAAAVADYAVSQTAEHKIKKDQRDLTLTLAKTPDILASVANLESPPFTVGFAAETQKLEQYAKAKLSNKRLDMIAANKVGKDIGFDSDINELHVYWHNGQQLLPLASKDIVARQLIELIAERLSEQRSPGKLTLV